MKLDQQNSYLKLFASCLPVKGEKQSLIYDFQRNDIYRISNTVFDILMSIEEMSYNEVLIKYTKAKNAINLLIEKEILFVTNEPDNFPAQSEEWFSPEDISNAIIEVNSASIHDYRKLFTDLNNLKCKNILFKINIDSPEKEIERILELGLLHETYFIEIWILGKLSKTKRNLFIRKFPILRKILIFDSTVKKNTLYCQCIVQYSDSKSFKEYCMEVYSDPIINYRFYCEAKLYNTCLNKKISIDSNGNIKNCLYLEQSFGNYKNDLIRDIVSNEEFTQNWHINRDSISKCHDCEFRYMCTDCSPFTFNKNNQTYKCYKDHALK